MSKSKSLAQGYLSQFKLKSDRVGAVVEAMQEAGKLKASGDLQHGQAKLIRVAACAAIIHTGELSVDLKGATLILDVNNACAMARQHYTALDYNSKEELETMDEERAKEVRKELAALLNPWMFKGEPLDHRLSLKDAKSEATNGGKIKLTAEELSLFDMIANNRKKTEEAIRIACLYVYWDRDGRLLEMFNKHEGLAIYDKAMLGYKKADGGHVYHRVPSRGPMKGFTDAVGRIPPLAGKRIGKFTGKVDMSAEGKLDIPCEVEPTLNQLEAAGIHPNSKDKPETRSKDVVLTFARSSLEEVKKLNNAKKFVVSANREKVLMELKTELLRLEKKLEEHKASIARVTAAEAKNKAAAQRKNNDNGYGHNKADGSPVETSTAA